MPATMTSTKADQRESLPCDVYIHLLEDKIWRLQRELDELVRLHYRLYESNE